MLGLGTERPLAAITLGLPIYGLTAVLASHRFGDPSVRDVLRQHLGVGACEIVSPLAARSAVFSVEFLCAVQTL